MAGSFSCGVLSRMSSSDVFKHRSLPLIIVGCCCCRLLQVRFRHFRRSRFIIAVDTAVEIGLVIHIYFAIYATMAVEIVVPLSLRIGQYLSMILGFGLSTLAVGARVYTKLRISRKFLLEDCKLSPLRDARTRSGLCSLSGCRFLSPRLGTMIA